MEKLKKITKYLSLMISGAFKKVAGVFAKIIKRIKKVRTYYKVATVYLLVIGLMVGIFIWRARSYYPEIPLGKQEAKEIDLYIDADINEQGTDFTYEDSIQTDPEPRITEEDTSHVSGQEEDIIELMWPIEGGTDNRESVEVEFGEFVRHDTRQDQNAHFYAHSGIDICVPEGTEVLAAGDGEVTEIKDLDLSFGKSVLLKHSEDVYTFYGSLSEISVELGQEVTAGQAIGEAGMTAIFDSGLEQPYLHFELRMNDKTVDPLNFLP